MSSNKEKSDKAGKYVKGHVCPSCDFDKFVVFYTVQNVPVHSVVNIDTREEALDFQRGHIALGFCLHCGFITNMAFNPELLDYSPKCEESQVFSSTYTRFAKILAEELVRRHNLYGKDIIEIGCGKGDFLALLCSIGNNRGIGFDPAYVPRRGQEVNKGQVRFIRDFFSEKHIKYQADFICCKMTLEHIYDTGALLNLVRRSIGDKEDTVVFFQVPNVIRILRDCAFEDIYYEHCSYFSPGSLARLFRKYGFNLIDLRTEYEGQYLVIEARSAKSVEQNYMEGEDDLEMLKLYVSTFNSRATQKIEKWRQILRGFVKDQKKVVLWGSGSKAVSFLTTLQVTNAVEYVVDINPYRQGYYMPGTGQKIVPPEFLTDYDPDFVIIMNSIYKREIQEDLEAMNLHPKLLTL